MSRRRYLSLGLVLAVLAGAACAQARSVPANLCSLRVSIALRELHVATTCARVATRTANGLTRLSANWGGRTLRDNGVQVVVVTGLSESAYELLVHPVGSPVRLGRLGRESAPPGGVVVSAWVNGVALEVFFFLPLLRSGSAAPDAGERYVAPALAFAETVARQV